MMKMKKRVKISRTITKADEAWLEEVKLKHPDLFPDMKTKEQENEDDNRHRKID